MSHFSAVGQERLLSRGSLVVLSVTLVVIRFDDRSNTWLIQNCANLCQGRLFSHLQTSAVTDVRTPPHRLLTWHGSRPKGTKGLLKGSGVRVRVR